MSRSLCFALAFGVLGAAFVLTSAEEQEKKEKTKSPDDQYVPGPDSKEQPGVPKGEITKHSWNESKVYPGTIRDYSVYVPQQYDEKKPACVAELVMRMYFDDDPLRAMKRARLMAILNALCSLAETPLNRRETILPRSVTNFCKNATFLYSITARLGI